MPELSNIQTYEKLEGKKYDEALIRFSNVLKQIDVWNNEIQSAFESFEWKVEDNGFVYSSIADLGFYKSKYSDIKLRPLLMAWTPAIDESFKENWISCDFLIETSDLKDFKTGEYKTTAYPLIKYLTEELAKEFGQTGIYFAGEAQDGQNFDGIRTRDSKKLWEFDYALIPKGLNQIYKNPPSTHQIIEREKHYESWFSGRWKEK